MCAAGNQENAREIASSLVDKHLAACVQISQIESYYRWKGEVQHEPELMLDIKTTGDRLVDVEKLIKQLHTYELPEIAAVPIIGGSAEYLNWIRESVA